MHATAIIPQLRTTDLDASIRFYTEVLGFAKKADVTEGPYRWLTVASPEEPEGAQQVRAGGHRREVQPCGVEGGQASPHQRLQPRTILVWAGEICAHDHDRAGSRLSGQAAGREDLLVPRIPRGKILTP